MKIKLIIASIFILYFTSVMADLNNEKGIKSCNVNIVCDEQIFNKSFAPSEKKKKLEAKNIEVIDKILQTTENLLSYISTTTGNLLSYISIGLAVVSLFITIIVSVAIRWMLATRKKSKREQEKSRKNILAQYAKIEKLLAKADADLHQLSAKTEKSIKKIKNKAADEFRIQTEEITLLTSKANEKLDETKKHLSKLDKTDELTTLKISAIPSTLIRCIEKAPNRDKAFSIYTRLLEAYDVLLKNPDQKINSILEEEMEIKAQVIQSYEEYVPPVIVSYMKTEMNLPESVLNVLWGK